MKKLILITFLLLSSVSMNFANAQSLKSNMKSVESLLKQVASKMNDASKNQENAANVNKMIALFETAKNQTPDSGSFAEYQGLMNQSIAIMKELENAFKTNDNVQVMAIMQKLNINKKEGHNKFK